MIKLNIEEMKVTEIEQYTYDISDIVKDVEGLKSLNISLNTKYGKSIPKNRWDVVDEWRLNDKANEEESMKYMKYVNLSFFEIIETEVDDADFIKTFRESKLNELI